MVPGPSIPERPHADDASRDDEIFGRRIGEAIVRTLPDYAGDQAPFRRPINLPCAAANSTDAVTPSYKAISKAISGSSA